MELDYINTAPLLKPYGLDTGGLQIDPYVGCSHFCKYCWLNNTACSSEPSVRLHVNLIDRLAIDLATIEPQRVYLGIEGDPYIPLEEEMHQTRMVLEILAASGFSVSIETKSSRILRDIDLIAKIPGTEVTISFAFYSEDDRRRFEDCPTSNGERLNTLAVLQDHGVRAIAAIRPVIPHLTKAPAFVEELMPYCDNIQVYPIKFESTDDPNWKLTEQVLSRHYPQYLGEVLDISFNHRHKYWAALRKRLRAIKPLNSNRIEIHL